MLLGFGLIGASMLGLANVTGWQPAMGSVSWNALHPVDMGVNVTGITHYGYGDLFPRARDEDVDLELAALQRMGVRVVRVFPAFDGISAQEAADRLDRFLTRAEAYHVSAIVSFVNYYASRQNPPELDPYYSDVWEGIRHLNHDFMARAYRGAYLDFVRTVVSRNRGHPNVYAWEPGNELQDPDRQAFLRMMQDVSAEIEQLDPGRPVSSGVIQASQAGFTPAELYSQLPSVQVVTIHPGNGYRGSVVDVAWAIAHGRKAIVEETGISAWDDRADRYGTELEYWRSRGVSAFLLDGFIAKGLEDNGNGDTTLGFDALWHTDYDRLAAFVERSSRPWPWQLLRER